MKNENWHGTSNGYGNRGCRCNLCRAAHREISSAMRENRYAQREEINGRLVNMNKTIVHGRYSTYYNWGCQCPPCYRAQRAYSRNLHARRKAA